MYLISNLFNPLNLKCDHDLTSCYSNTESFIKIINQNSRNDHLLLCVLNKSLLLVPKESIDKIMDTDVRV